jgi:hypothetical protein
MAKDDNPMIESDIKESGEMSEAEIDRNLMETFPASDPPSWTLGTNHQEEKPNEKGQSIGGDQEE